MPFRYSWVTVGRRPPLREAVGVDVHGRLLRRLLTCSLATWQITKAAGLWRSGHWGVGGGREGEECDVVARCRRNEAVEQASHSVVGSPAPRLPAASQVGSVWPSDWSEVVAGNSCAMCANQGREDNGYGVRFFKGCLR